MTAVLDRIRRAGCKALVVNSVPRDIAIRAIILETACLWEEAESTLEWINRFVHECREGGYYPVHPTDADMLGREYEIFDLVVPHDGTAKLGSAHKAIEKALLDPSKDEFALRHFQIKVGSREDCNVEVCVNAPQVEA